MKPFALSLKHFITINAPAVGADASGQPLTGMTLFTQVWANIANAGGLESIKAGAVTSTVKVSIRIWYREDITASMQVVYGAAKYRILAILPDVGGKRHVDLVCEQDDHV